MTRLIGIDLCSNPAHGVVIDLPSAAHSGVPVRCLASLSLNPDNRDDIFHSALVSADGSTAVICPSDSFGLNLALPFADKKRVGALLPQELEDTLPFPSSEFTFGVAWSGTGTTTSSSSKGGAHSATHQFHLHLAPKDSVRGALSRLAALGIDPTIVTPRSALLTPIAEALIDYRARATADLPPLQTFFVIVPRSPQEADILFVLHKRVIHHEQLRPLTTDAGLDLTGAALLEIGMIFRRFGANITEGFIVVPLAATVDGIKAIDSLRTGADLRIETVTLSSLFPDLELTPSNETAVLAAFYSLQSSSLSDVARANGFQAEAVNFRRGEFSYRPPLGEVIRIAKQLIRPIFWTALCMFACATVLYLFRAQEISRLQYRIADAVYSVAPQLGAENGQELTALSDEAGKMEQELKDIGTSDSSSPLELYVDLTRHFPQLADTTVDRVSIRGNRVEIRGCAPSYRVIEQIENALNKVRTFGKVKKGSSQSCSGGGSGSRGFTFEVTPRD